MLNSRLISASEISESLPLSGARLVFHLIETKLRLKSLSRSEAARVFIQLIMFDMLLM